MNPTPSPWADARCPELCDEITVMRAPGRRLAKLFPAPGADAIGYDETKLFNARTTPLAGLHDVRDLVANLMQQADCMVVRGELIAGASATRIRRLAYLDKETGDEPTLRDMPRRWLALDCDGVERPEHVAPHNLEACFDVVLERLPEPFQAAGCVVQASASHAIKPGIRLRLWWWCDRPMGCDELKRWLGKIPGIDRSIFNPAQPIYTARPVFGPGVSDPMPGIARLWECPGLPWVLCPTEEELAPPPRAIPETTRPVCVSSSARAQLYVEGALNNAHTRINSAIHRHPTILAQACSLARFVNAKLITETQLHNVLWDAAKSAGKDDEKEIGRMVSFGLAHPDTGPLPVEFRNG